jgi:structural maintenance of chromosome 3 (chondroitin sulfate proteoglycan 6)
MQQQAADNIKAISKDVRELKARVQTYLDERDAMMGEHQELTKQKAKLELNIKDLQEELDGDSGAKNKLEVELQKLKEKAEKTQEQLDGIAPKYEQMRQREESAATQLALAEQRRKELYAKQGRGNQFTSREERDRWISKELKSLNKAIRDKDEQIRRLRDDLQNDQTKESTLEVQIGVSTSGHCFGIYCIVYLCRKSRRRLSSTKRSSIKITNRFMR